MQSIEQTIRQALVDQIVTEQEVTDFLRAMRLIKEDTGFGVITHELKHGGVSNIEVKVHWKPSKKTSTQTI